MAGALLGAIGGLAGGIFGDITSRNAGKQLGQAANSAATAIGTAGNQAAAATDVGVTGVQNAGAAGVSGINNSVNTGQAGVTAGAGQAQMLAGNLYGGELGNLQQYNSTGQTGSAAEQNLINQGFQAPTAAQAAATPGEQFALQQGEQGTLQALGATGGAATGGAEKALTQYGQNVASTYYQNAFNNAQSVYNTNLNAASGAAQQGLSAAGLTNQAAQNYQATSQQNLVQAPEYNATLGLTGATAAGQLGLGAANSALGGMEAAGNQNLQGTTAASQMFYNGALGNAAGQIGGANSLMGGMSGLSGFGNLFSSGSLNPYGIGSGSLGAGVGTPNASLAWNT